MSTAERVQPVTVALIGNPNTGKSTLFNALSGVRQRVGNYPGVTVEKKVGHAEIAGQKFSLIDLPGTYSLAPRSPDEMVTVDVLLGHQADTPPADVILCIVDASNLERNLYLVSQALELGRPTALALNMVDVATSRGISVDVGKLQQRLGIPVVAVQAHKKLGLEELGLALAAAAQQSEISRASPFPPAFVAEVAALAKAFDSCRQPGEETPPRYVLERLLLDTGGYLEERMKVAGHSEIQPALAAARDRLEQADCPVPAIEAIARYDWVAQMLDGVVQRPDERRVTISDRIDRFLTHRIWGTLAFIVVMVLMFQAVFSWSEPLKGALDALKGKLADAVSSWLAPGALQSLLTDGVVEGIGGVITFLPQIAILFCFIAILEDCGYMSRAAYLMDRLMSPAGLSGKSFIPLLSSFACAVPGVMATRVIENRRDRLATMLVAPLMSCSARIPVYTLLTMAFLPNVAYLGGWLSLRGLIVAGMYLLGIIVAMTAAFVFKRTLLKGEAPPFVMELPNYKMPAVPTVCMRILERCWAFIAQAGTVILAVAVIVWAASYYPHNSAAIEAEYGPKLKQVAEQLEKLDNTAANAAAREKLLAEEKQIHNDKAGEYQRQSYLGQAGKLIEPAVRPLGWDWRIGCAVIASFPAREVVIATLGVIYNQGKDVEAESEDLHEILQNATWDNTGEKVFNVPVALSIMVFFALCAQCVSTLAVIRRETNSWRWPTFTFAYMTTLAYIGAWLTYHVGMWLS